MIKSNNVRDHCVMESPYYTGHNTTSLPAVTIYNNSMSELSTAFEEPFHPPVKDPLEELLKASKQGGGSQDGSPGSPVLLEKSKLNRSSKLDKRTTKFDIDSLPTRKAYFDRDSDNRLDSPRAWYQSQGFNHSQIMNLKKNVLPVAGVAASYYNGGWLPLSGQVATNNVAGINDFVTECRAEVEAGLPGRPLTVVLGSKNSGLDSMVPTICYAFFLHIKCQAKDKCYIPVLNMKRSDFAMHTEAVWLFNSVGLDVAQLIFADEVSLLYYQRIGNLKLVLVNHEKPEPPYEALNDTVVQILSPDMEKVGSCCTLVAEKFASEAPEFLLGRGVSRLLLAGIIVDTSNLDLSTGKCANRDICMVTMLLNGAGRYGRHGFFKLLRKHMFDVTNLSPRDLLCKYTKQWTCETGNSCRSVSIGLCSLGISIGRFLSVETAVSDQVSYFRASRKLDLFLIITGHHNRMEAFSQELLIATQNEDMTDELGEFFVTQGLQLKSIHTTGIPSSMKAFSVITASSWPMRVLIQQATSDFFKGL